MSGPGTLDETSRSHGGHASSPPRHHDPREGYPQGGQGFARQRNADRSAPPDTELHGGFLDSRLVELKYLDPITGAAWTGREGPRLRGFTPGDIPDMLYDKFTASDGEERWVCLDGQDVPFRGSDRYGPDVGRSMGTTHLPAEDWPILPGRRFGPKRLHGDMTFLCPDQWYKRWPSAGDGHNQTGAMVKRTTPASDIETAATDRQLTADETEDAEFDVPGGSGAERMPMTRGPGWVPGYVMLYERWSANARGNALLVGSTVPSQVVPDDVLDTDTVYNYQVLEASAPVSSTPGFPFCSLTPYGNPPPRVDLNLHSEMVARATLARWVVLTLDPGAMRENILRNHNFIHSVASYVRDLVCCLFNADDLDDARECLRVLSERAPAICKAKCEEEAVTTGP